jgi:hypothetical protein
MFAVTQSKVWANTFWPATVKVADTEVVIEGRKQIIFWFTRPYQHVLPYRQMSTVNIEQGVAASTINIQMTSGALYNIAALPHEGATQAANMIRQKLAQIGA